MVKYDYVLTHAIGKYTKTRLNMPGKIVAG